MPTFKGTNPKVTILSDNPCTWCHWKHSKCFPENEMTVAMVNKCKSLCLGEALTGEKRRQLNKKFRL